MLFDSPIVIAGTIFAFFTIGYIYLYLTDPLRSIPGPFLARFNRLWYFHSIYKGNFEHVNAALHKIHGTIVRLAPGQYSISDPEAIKTIYKPRHGELQFRKADFYAAWEVPHQPNIFSGRDPVRHDRDRKKLNSAYTMSVMTSYEDYVNNCVEIFSQRMREKSQQSEEIDMAWWLQCFAFDVIGEITYSKRFGFLDEGKDQNGLIENVHGNNVYSLFMGIIPEWHEFVYSMIGWLGKMGIGQESEKNYLIDFTIKSKERRQSELERAEEAGCKSEDGPKDFMTKFIEQHRNDPSHFTLSDIISGVGGNINAGSDTTGITLSAITYHLLANPRTLHRLRTEIQEHAPSDPITFKEAQKLEYLQAVIKETLRIHPPIGIPLSRVVPQGGAMIAGHLFPAGSVVGMNPYVLHHDPEVYGPDVEEFRPERWLKSENDPETLARMERSWCPFGMGSRMCIGKNVSLLEISKLVPRIVRDFDFGMSDELQREGLKTSNEFFVQIENLRLRVEERRQEETC